MKLYSIAYYNPTDKQWRLYGADLNDEQFCQHLVWKDAPDVALEKITDLNRMYGTEGFFYMILDLL